MKHSLIDLMKPIEAAYQQDEEDCLAKMLPEAMFNPPAIERIQTEAKSLMLKIREDRLKRGGLDAFLYQYDLSSEEGIALMCLAEALLRIPDAKTRDRLIKDKIVAKDWERHLGKSHSWFVNAGTLGLMLTGKMLKSEEAGSERMMSTLKRLMNRVGEPLIRQAIAQGMKILGRQFVMGETIEEALKRAKAKEAQGYRYSYDMLGEAAKTEPDAEHYFDAYWKAIQSIGQAASGLGPHQSPGVSIKLSALHPRYEWLKRERMMEELLPKLLKLAQVAKQFDIGLTIDAEEADRLELSLLLFEAMAKDTSLNGWQGLGLAVQSYQKRAYYVIDWLAQLAKQTQRKIMLRLVKGAYWDSEIKWAQEKGLSGYPVFTRKSSTDVSFIACAKKILSYGDCFFPQFATHNAYSVAAILELVGDLPLSSQKKIRQNAEDCPFEFQCLHGMGDSLYDNIVGSNHLNIPCRIYAPVGGHEYLLAYLVRRLLENGANTSFVNRIIDEQLPLEDLLQDPIVRVQNLPSKPHPKIPLPRNLYQPHRLNSVGINLNDPLESTPLMAEIQKHSATLFKNPVHKCSMEELEKMLSEAAIAAKDFRRSDPEYRAQLLEGMAKLLEENSAPLLALLIREGGKTVQDGISEWREAVDFCHYYAWRCREDFKPLLLPGPTGEHNQLNLYGRGVIACISPWNFPLAIFLGQILGALAAGNAVIAKPASQTPFIAEYAVSLLYKAGFPKTLVHLAIGSGATVGEKLMKDLRINGVMFTGSTETGAEINRTLANRSGPIVPLIAETGGQNVMIVDSSALPEQVVQDAITSAFNSAGQRCSALRVLYLQEEVADKIIKMLIGAMAELQIGDPIELQTDVGPVIDDNARRTLEKHVERMDKEATLLYRCDFSQKGGSGGRSDTSKNSDIVEKSDKDDEKMERSLPNLPRGVFFAPRAYEIKEISQLKHEVFGPILHVIRYSMDNLDTIINSINEIGYGLTLGIHSRINEVAEEIFEQLNVGNTYVNRNMIGAVVGVQPFGGQGLSGTGPKAGGPHMLPRLALERTLSVNIAAAGGNLALMSMSEET